MMEIAMPVPKVEVIVGKMETIQALLREIY